MFSYESQTESGAHFSRPQNPYFGALYCGAARSAKEIEQPTLSSGDAGTGAETGGPGGGQYP